MTRTAQETASFLAAHAAPLPAHVTRESVRVTLALMNRDASRASAIAPNASHESHHDSEGRALFTVTRPRVLDRDGLFQLHLCDGRLVAAFARVPTIRTAFESVIVYLAQALPADCDPAAEAESYRASFRENWYGDLAASNYPIFRASALSRAARWAYRIAAAEAAIAEGQDRESYSDDQDRDSYTVAEAPAPLRIKLEGRRTLDQLEAGDAAAKAEARAQRKGLDQLEAEAEAPRPEVVDLTPTWAGVARMIELGLTNGNARGRQIAREELDRMAALADSAVAAAKDTARAEALEMARSCLAAYPLSDLERQKGGAAWRQTATDLRDSLAGLVAALS